MRRTLAILASAAVAASTVAIAAPAQAANTISGGGASFPYPFLSQCAADFNASQSNFDIQYTSTGSGTGKSNFTKGQFVYAQTDSKYTSGEPTFDWEYIPNIGGAIAFPINLKNATTGRSLGSSIQLKQTTLAKLHVGRPDHVARTGDPQGQPAYRRSDPERPGDRCLPLGQLGHVEQHPAVPQRWAPSIWSKVQDDFSTAFPGGKPPTNSVAGKDNAAVLSLVAAKAGTIGYVDFGDAKGYPSARIQNANGEFIAPSSASAAKNLANQTNVAANGLVSLNYKLKVAGAYPVAIFSYMLARTDGKGPNGLGVRQFADYVLQKCGPARAASLGYVPVGGKVLAKAKTLVTQHQVACAAQRLVDRLHTSVRMRTMPRKTTINPGHRPRSLSSRLALVACTPPLPPDVLAAQAEKNITCQNGQSGRQRSRPTSWAPWTRSARASPASARTRPSRRCRTRPDAKLQLIDHAPTPSEIATFGKAACPAGTPIVVPAFGYAVALSLRRDRPGGTRPDPAGDRRDPQRHDHVVGGSR